MIPFFKIKIGKNCELKSHVSIVGNTTIGEENIFYPTKNKEYRTRKKYVFKRR